MGGDSSSEGSPPRLRPDFLLTLFPCRTAVMSLTATIKKQMFAAMKAGNTTEKEILRVALGEITMTEARQAKELSDEEVHGILKKLLKSNRESLDHVQEESARQQLLAENSVLEQLLPRVLGVDEIISALESITSAIQEAKAAGPAVGLAMKHLKQAELNVEAPAVAAAVEKIRAS